MATSYHISPNGPRLCRAEQGLCPYGRAGQPHYATLAEAEGDYASRMEAQYGVFVTVDQGLGYEARMQAYALREEFIGAKYQARADMLASVNKVKASAPVQATARTLAAVKAAPSRAAARIDKFEARMRARAQERRLQRELQAERVRAKASAAKAMVMGEVRKAAADVKDTYYLVKAAAEAARPEPAPRPLSTRPTNLQVGDYLEGNLRVAKLTQLDNGDVKALVRGAGGTFAGSRVYSPSDRVAVKRWDKRDERAQAAGRRAPLRSRPFFQRLSQATEMQRDVFRALRATDSFKARGFQPSSRNMKAPMPESLRGPVAPTASVAAYSSLASVAAQKPRRAVKPKVTA